MTKSSAASPFFGAYNARHINAEEVARQFVSSRKFVELTQLRNSLLIGPRGSGKTHLLKMLQPKALAAWEGLEADDARSRIDYWGVFTPADINWKAQVDTKVETLSAEAQSEFSNAIFLAYFREAFVTCLLQLTRDRPLRDFGGPSTRVEISKDKEIALCLALAEAWQLRLRVPSLDGLKLAIVDELVRVGTTEASSGLSPYMLRLAKMDVLGVARELAEHFVSVTGIYSARWALCFDELEIAPAWIQRSLFRYLRSTDPRFVFKLAISPSNDASSLLNQEATASAGNDYDPIPLWFADHREREQFCLRLWEKHAAGTKAATLSPEALLGRSRFQFPNEETSHGRRRYLEDSGWTRDFERLARIDKSFAEYLERHEIYISALARTPRAKMDAVVRKVAPIVGFRSAYLAPAPIDGIGAPMRRKMRGPPADVFSGWDAVCTATEGNPRWFSGIASRLILRWDQSTSGRALTREKQVQELDASAKKFLAWINAIPIETTEGSAAQLSLYDLVDAVAAYFEHEALGKLFKPDPVSSFIVDAGTPLPIQRLVMAALNIGAIVILDDQNFNFTAPTPLGRRFRLVHLLAPRFNLPMRKGKSRNLSTILTKQLGPLDKFSGVSRKVNARPDLDQMGLFSEP